MQFNNIPQRYGVVPATLHWLVTIAVYGMSVLGLWMVTLSYYDGWYHQAPEPYKSTGVLLIMGLVIRVIWRLSSSPPAVLASYSRLTRIVVTMGHLVLYSLLFSIVISGYLIPAADGKAISVFGWFDILTTLANAGAQADPVGSLHLWFVWTMVVLSLLHGLVALKHHFIDNDNTLSRILGKSSSDYGVQNEKKPAGTYTRPSAIHHRAGRDGRLQN